MFEQPTLTQLSCMRRQCGTCAQWQGERQLVLGPEGATFVVADNQGGNCEGGVWRSFSTLPQQSCEQYQRWSELFEEPCDPVVPSSVCQMQLDLRMHSHLAAQLPSDMQKKLDDILLEIELWHNRRQLDGSGAEEIERDCFYYLGWGRRTPLSAQTQDDICG